MRYIWKGPGVLNGKGKPVYPGEPIPEGHVTDERIKRLRDRIQFLRDPAPAKKPEPEPKPEPTKPEEKPKRGRPPKKGKE